MKPSQPSPLHNPSKRRISATLPVEATLHRPRATLHTLHCDGSTLHAPGRLSSSATLRARTHCVFRATRYTGAMSTTPLRAYHGDHALREATIARMREHAAADEIIQGRYWEHGKGCLVGCAIHDAPPEGRHAAFPRVYGIPEVVARLADRIFEGLTPTEAKELPVAFFEASPAGADLALAWPRFAVALMIDPEHGVARLTAAGTPARAAIEAVAALYQRVIDGDAVSAEEWAAHADAAASAAADAAASDAAASYAAASYAYAAYASYAAASYASYAYAADAASAYAAASAPAYTWQASTLLTILASCPVTP